jgi:hypothetical protein
MVVLKLARACSRGEDEEGKRVERLAMHPYDT